MPGSRRALSPRERRDAGAVPRPSDEVRRRGIRDPARARRATEQLARVPARAEPRAAGERRARAGAPALPPLRRVGRGAARASDRPAGGAPRDARGGRAGRRADEPDAARRRPRASPPAPRRRRPDRRLPRLRAGRVRGRDPEQPPRADGRLHHAGRRRGRGDLEHDPPRRRPRAARAALRLPRPLAGPPPRPGAAPRRRDAAALRVPPLRHARCRSRLPVRVLVPHDHQRPGSHHATARGVGGGRRDRAQLPRARNAPLLLHRRQLRPAPRLARDLHRARRAARATGRPGALPDAGRHARRPHPRLRLARAPCRLLPGLHRHGKPRPAHPARRPARRRTASRATPR